VKILIIDDSRSQLTVINKIIAQLKIHQTYLALDALEGFVMLRAIPGIDFIVVDYNMPYINGVEFIKKIKNTPPFDKIPIIVSSAQDLSNEYKAAGADYCLIKPYSVKGFQDIIDKVDSQTRNQSFTKVII